MTDRKTASTINDTELDALYERLERAETHADPELHARLTAALDVLGKAENELARLRRRIEDVQRQRDEQDSAIARVRHLAAGAADTTAAGISDYDIGRHELAQAVLAALDEPGPA